MRLENPEQLSSMLEGLALSPAQQFELNRKLANRARQFFRGQISKQRDIDNNPYQARRKRKVSIVSRGMRGKHGTKHQYNKVARNTVNNKNMLLGLSRALKTVVSDDAFKVELTGVPGKIARQHNEGQTLSFTTRLNGFYNSKTNQWEGGTRTKGNYRMPKRTLLGWTPTLERELMAMISAELLTNMET